MARKIDEKTICPKCGYDQSGIIATWTDACPLHGQCAECGLDFAWSDVMDPFRVALPWYVEHASTKRAALRRTIRTIWMLAIPNRFWKRVGVHTAVNIRLLMMWVALIFAFVAVLSSGLLLFSFIEGRRVFSGTWVGMVQGPKMDFWDHLSKIPGSWWLKFGLDSVFYPFRPAKQLQVDFSRNIFGLSRWLFGMSLLWLIMLAVAPVTRRMAKLRFVHVVRALIICTGLCVVLICGARIIDALIKLEMIYLGTTQLSVAMEWVFVRVLLIGLTIWVQWFWISAIRVGWRIRPSWLLIFLGLIASLLGGLFLALSSVYFQ